MCADLDPSFSENVSSLISALECVYQHCQSTGSQRKCQEVVYLLHRRLSAFHSLSAGIASGVGRQDCCCCLQTDTGTSGEDQSVRGGVCGASLSESETGVRIPPDTSIPISHSSSTLNSSSAVASMTSTSPSSYISSSHNQSSHVGSDKATSVCSVPSNPSTGCSNAPTEQVANGRRAENVDVNTFQQHSLPAESNPSDEGEWKVVMSRSKQKALSKRRGMLDGGRTAGEHPSLSTCNTQISAVDQKGPQSQSANRCRYRGLESLCASTIGDSSTSGLFSTGSDRSGLSVRTFCSSRAQSTHSVRHNPTLGRDKDCDLVPDAAEVNDLSVNRDKACDLVPDAAEVNDLSVNRDKACDSADVRGKSVNSNVCWHSGSPGEKDPDVSRVESGAEFGVEGREGQDHELLPAETDTGGHGFSHLLAASSDLLHQATGGNTNGIRGKRRGEESDDSEECMAETEMALNSAIAHQRCLEKQLIETRRLQPRSEFSITYDGPHVTDCITVSECSGGMSWFDHSALSSASSSPPVDAAAHLNMDEEAMTPSSPRNRPPDKLMSPKRMQQPAETIRRHKERQQKAQRLRTAFIEQKTQKLSDISRKIEIVRQQQEVLVEQRRALLEKKMARAEQRRQRHLLGIVRRAHDEEEKAREIAFINEIEAQNKRHDFLESVQSQEARLVELQEERQRRMEEKAAAAAAVVRKRRQLQQQRREQLELMKQRRLSKLQRIDRELRDKEKERQELAREKERDRLERRSALEAAHQATVEQLDQRIRQKQLASARRHEENIHGIRRRALELSVRCAASGDSALQIGQTAVYDTKKVCTLCDVLIGSERSLLSHLRGEQHQLSLREKFGSELNREQLMAVNLVHIGDARARHVFDVTFSGSRQQRLHRLRRKISSRWSKRSLEYACVCEVGKHCSCLTGQLSWSSPDSASSLLPPHPWGHGETADCAGGRAVLLRAVRSVSGLQKKQGAVRWTEAAVLSLLRQLKQTQSCLKQQQQQQQRYWYQLLFCSLGGAGVLASLLQEVCDQLVDGVEILPPKAVVAVASVLSSVCEENSRVCVYFCAANLVRAPLDLLVLRLTLLNCTGSTDVEWDPATSSLLHLVSVILLSLHRQQLPAKQQGLLHDICSYSLCVGLVDWISSYFSWTNADLNSESHLFDFLLQGLRFLRALSTVCLERGRPDVRDLLVDTLRVTRLSHVVQLLYTLLLARSNSQQQRQQQQQQQQQLQLTEQARELTLEAFHTLNQVSALDIDMFQSCFSEEGGSLEFRHIASLLLGCCCSHQYDPLLQLIIGTVGRFAVCCPDNQTCLLTGQNPTVVQQLLLLPLTFFIEQERRVLLFPTLLACCHGNQQAVALVEQEMNYQTLEEFLYDKKNANNTLIARILNKIDGKEQRT